ncbi:MAG: GNAT family N-acetyltransferase [Syntrophomonadaceae bacterium]|jgi:diamine N-acetyltransferase|nr:GNAT family N-acetyltransferase [Syntrophomonadaceae bacterium]
MLENINIELNPFEEKHLERTLQWVNDIEIMNRINRVLPVTMFEHQEWFKKITLDSRQVVFAIENKATGNHLGNCGLRDIDYRSRKAELWIYLGSNYHRHGTGTIATQLLIDYGFSYLNLNRIYLYTLEYNEAAIRTFSHCGMVEEGRFRQDVFICNRYYDTIRMAILRSNYR